MLVADGDLDQSVQELASRSFGASPDFLPFVVASVVVACVEQLRAGNEVSVFFVRT